LQLCCVELSTNDTRIHSLSLTIVTSYTYCFLSGVAGASPIYSTNILDGAYQIKLDHYMYTSRLVFTARLRPRSQCRQFGMPAERRAQFRVPNVLHSEYMNTPNVEILCLPLCTAPMSYLAGSKWGRPLCYRQAAARWCLQRARGACGGRIVLNGVSRPYLRYGDRGRLQNVSYPSVLFELSRIFFTVAYTGDTDTKNVGPEF